MIDFRLFHASAYRSPEEGDWRNPLPYICLQVAGLRWRMTAGSREERPRLPRLELVPAGRRSRFSYGPDRENWVIQLISDDVADAPDPDRCLLRSGGSLVAVPALVPLSAARCRAWQRHCERLCTDALSPDPLRQLRVRAAVCELLAVFVEAADADTGGDGGGDSAEHLRRAIDDDRACSKKLDGLSRELGYSGDHLRRLFVARFGITPMQYRTQRRMALAADLVATGAGDLAAIAAELGFHQASHFCAAYRQHFGSTPGRDMRRQRRG